MRRRDFIKVVAGSVAAWPFATRAQPSEPAREPASWLADSMSPENPESVGLTPPHLVSGHFLSGDSK